jgi:hypothetical protein
LPEFPVSEEEFIEWAEKEWPHQRTQLVERQCARDALSFIRTRYEAKRKEGE